MIASTTLVPFSLFSVWGSLKLIVDSIVMLQSLTRQRCSFYSKKLVPRLWSILPERLLTISRWHGSSDQWAVTSALSSGANKNEKVRQDRGVKFFLLLMSCTNAWDSMMLEGKDSVSYYWCEGRPPFFSYSFFVGVPHELIKAVLVKFWVTMNF